MLSIISTKSATPPSDLETKVHDGLLAIGLQRQKIDQLRSSQFGIPKEIKNPITGQVILVTARPATSKEIDTFEDELRKMIAALSPLENQLQREQRNRLAAEERDMIVAQLEDVKEHLIIVQRQVRTKRADPDALLPVQREIARLEAQLAVLDAARDKEAQRVAAQTKELPAVIAEFKAAAREVARQALVLREKHERLATIAAKIKTFEAPSGALHTHIPGLDTAFLALANVRSRASFDGAVANRPDSMLSRFIHLCNQFGIKV
jgi:chromosome segregation ATPase